MEDFMSTVREFGKKKKKKIKNIENCLQGPFFSSP